MPEDTAEILDKMISTFIWKDDSSPKIAEETLRRPINQGGLDLLNLEARNKAINIIWLKEYLNFSTTRLEWATITDLIIETSAPKRLNKRALINPFLQH